MASTSIRSSIARALKPGFDITRAKRAFASAQLRRESNKAAEECLTSSGKNDFTQSSDIMTGELLGKLGTTKIDVRLLSDFVWSDV